MGSYLKVTIPVIPFNIFNLFIYLNTEFSSIPFPGALLILEPCILYFGLVSLLCFIKMLFIRVNHRPDSMLTRQFWDFLCQHNSSISLHPSIWQTLWTSAKKKKTKNPQFKSPSVPLSSMFLLGWPVKPNLKHSTLFLIQNPPKPHSFKQKNGQAY